MTKEELYDRIQKAIAYKAQLFAERSAADKKMRLVQKDIDKMQKDLITLTFQSPPVAPVAPVAPVPAVVPPANVNGTQPAKPAKAKKTATEKKAEAMPAAAPAEEPEPDLPSDWALPY
jgi:hypothetical protein